MKIDQCNLDGRGGEFKLTTEVEKIIAEFLGVKHCIMVDSGTGAIFLALKATGAKKVAIPALTMFGTAAAAELAGCEIVFVTNNEIPDGVDTYVHVSLNGRDCGIAEVIAKYPHLTIIEDSCQAFGSQHQNKYLGTFGKIGCFSFSPHKIISAGNGGAIVTNDDDLALSVRKLKNFGRSGGGGDQHDTIGYNFKFTDLQAGFMLEQLKDLPTKLARKKAMYARYYAELSSIMLPHPSVPWSADIYIEDRDGLIAHLTAKEIGTRKMYPLLTTQKPFIDYQLHGNYTEDKRRAEQGLWLPSSYNITDQEIDVVITAIKDWLKN